VVEGGRVEAVLDAAVENDDGDERFERREQFTPEPPGRPERDGGRQLTEQKERPQAGAEDPMGDIHQQPRQRRMLPVAELPV
jgi:hypothetical protein